MQRKPVDILIIGDPFKDPDDEHAAILAAGLHRQGIIRLVGFVANLRPSDKRAESMRGMLDALGLYHIPVGRGQECVRPNSGVVYPYETQVSYWLPESNQNSRIQTIQSGPALIDSILREAADPVTIVLNSALTDAALAFMANPELFTEKVKKVVVMGGVEVQGDNVVLDNDGYLMPSIGRGGAANNCYDAPAALYLYRALQEYGIQTITLTRHAAYACQMPFRLYDQAADTGHVGQCLRARQQPSIAALWKAANAPEGSPERGKLPVNRDRLWFINVFCGGIDPGIGADEDIWLYVRGFQLYDPMNVIAAVRELRDRFYNTVSVIVNNVEHGVIGISPDRHGVCDADALREFLIQTELSAICSAASLS